eukprot:CFRG3628T1
MATEFSCDRKPAEQSSKFCRRIIKALRRIALSRNYPPKLYVPEGVCNDPLYKTIQTSWLVDKKRSLFLILSDSEGYSTFLRFLESEYSSVNLTFWLELESLKGANDRAQLKKMGTNVLRRFLGTDCEVNISGNQRDSLKHTLSFSLAEDIQTDVTESVAGSDLESTIPSSSHQAHYGRSIALNFSDEEYTIIESVQHAILSFLALDSFPRFLGCPMGEEYVKSLLNRYPSVLTDVSKESMLHNQLIEFQEQALAVSKVNPSKSWLAKFISVAYMLPFCVTVSARVRLEDAGTEGEFPLSFVNPHFTLVTGYSYAETVGRNCRFLQGATTEETKRDQLRFAIDTGVRVHTSITNFTKAGVEFKNLLTLQPVKDTTGIVVYFVGIQYDITGMDVENLACLAPVLDFLAKNATV